VDFIQLEVKYLEKKNHSFGEKSNWLHFGFTHLSANSLTEKVNKAQQFPLYSGVRRPYRGFLPLGYMLSPHSGAF